MRRSAPAEKGLGDVVEFVRDVVLAVKLRLVEDRGENLFGQDVLNQHLAHVVQTQVRVDGFLDEFEQTVALRDEACVVGGLVFDDCAYLDEQVGQVVL